MFHVKRQAYVLAIGPGFSVLLIDGTWMDLDYYRWRPGPRIPIRVCPTRSSAEAFAFEHGQGDIVPLYPES